MVKNTPILVDPLEDYVKDGIMYPTKRTSSYAILYDGGHAYAYIPKSKTDKDLVDLALIIQNMNELL